MDTLKLMTVFVAVAEERSFAGGARKLAMSPPAVTRAIAALEAQLGVKLLERTTRAMQVTSVGEHYLHDSRRIIEEVSEANETAAGINAMPQGDLAVTAPVLFGNIGRATIYCFTVSVKKIFRETLYFSCLATLLI